MIPLLTENSPEACAQFCRQPSLPSGQVGMQFGHGKCSCLYDERGELPLSSLLPDYTEERIMTSEGPVASGNLREGWRCYPLKVGSIWIQIVFIFEWLPLSKLNHLFVFFPSGCEYRSSQFEWAYLNYWLVNVTRQKSAPIGYCYEPRHKMKERNWRTFPWIKNNAGPQRRVPRILVREEIYLRRTEDIVIKDRLSILLREKNIDV